MVQFKRSAGDQFFVDWRSDDETNMTLHGHVENGAIIFDPPIALPEGAAVEVQVMSIAPAQEVPAIAEGSSLLERMKDFVGTFEGLPPDASVNLDHYLYGSSKRP
jgi:hypothetical protein